MYPCPSFPGAPGPWPALERTSQWSEPCWDSLCHWMGLTVTLVGGSVQPSQFPLFPRHGMEAFASLLSSADLSPSLSPAAHLPPH